MDKNREKRNKRMVRLLELLQQEPCPVCSGAWEHTPVLKRELSSVTISTRSDFLAKYRCGHTAAGHMARRFERIKFTREERT